MHSAPKTPFTPEFHISGGTGRIPIQRYKLMSQESLGKSGISLILPSIPVRGCAGNASYLATGGVSPVRGGIVIFYAYQVP